MPEVTIRIETISVIGRHRKDLGDIKSLAADIEANGLINPITVTPSGRLLAGQRRLEAFRVLGRDQIQARIVDTFDDAALALRIERSENTQRKEMRPSELVELGRALEAMDRPAAKEATRQRMRASAQRREARKRGEPAAAQIDDYNSGSPEPESDQSINEAVATALGMSRPTYQRLKTVVGAVNDPTRSPEQRALAAQAVADLDAGTESVTGAYERLRTNRPASQPRVRSTIDKPAAQRRAISTAEAALSGIAHGLDQITDLHEEITSEEAARWVDSLSDSRRVITSLINRLKERSNGIA